MKIYFFYVLTYRLVFEKNAKGLSSAPTLPNLEYKKNLMFRSFRSSKVRTCRYRTYIYSATGTGYGTC